MTFEEKKALYKSKFITLEDALGMIHSGDTIAQAAYEVLYEGRDAHLVLTELMTREKKHELEDSWV